MKILILKPSSLGDVVHALPVLRMLKRHRPESEIFWWINEDLAPLLEDDPDLSGRFVFNRRNWNLGNGGIRALRGIQAMRREQFDVALDLQGLSRSAVVAWLSGAETVIGLEHTREGAGMAYDVTAARVPWETLATERYLSVLPLLGVPVRWDFEWLPVRKKVAARVREQAQAKPGRWVMLLPGARWDNKRWPVELYAQTVKLLAARDSGLSFAVLGARSDSPLAESIVRTAPERCLNLTGRTSLPEMIEWLRLADAVIANDTGPLHIAAALGRPLVPIYGPTNPRRTGPHGQVNDVLQARDLECVPCMKDSCSHREPLACLRAITPEQVCERTTVLLAMPKK